MLKRFLLLKDLLFSFHDNEIFKKITNDEVSNLIKFLCLYEEDYHDYLKWYIMYLLDSVDGDYYEQQVQKVVVYFKSITLEIRKFSSLKLDKKKVLEKETYFWFYGSTSHKFDDEKIKQEEQRIKYIENMNKQEEENLLNSLNSTNK